MTEEPISPEAIKVFFSQNQEEFSPTILVRRANQWSYGKLRAASSLVSVLKQQRGLTTAGICQFFDNFGLTLHDCARDNPEKTIEFIKGICGQLLDWASERKRIPETSIENLKKLIAGLALDSPPELRQTLEETIEELEAI